MQVTVCWRKLLTIYETPEEMLKVNKTAVRQYDGAHGSYNKND